MEADEATVTLSLRAGDEANVIAQQCCSRFNGPLCVVSKSALLC